MNRGTGLDIVVVGAGNVATHLAHAFAASGNRIAQVYSRKLETAQVLAQRFGVPYTNNFAESRCRRIYILCCRQCSFRHHVAYQACRQNLFSYFGNCTHGGDGCRNKQLWSGICSANICKAYCYGLFRIAVLHRGFQPIYIGYVALDGKECVG